MSNVDTSTADSPFHQQRPTATATSTAPAPAPVTVTATATATADHRLSSKRKLDEYGPAFDDEDDVVLSDLVSVKMRKDESSGDGFHNSSADGQSLTAPAPSFPAPSPTLSHPFTRSTDSESTLTDSRLQFFVRMISQGNTLVIQANPDDTVKSLHERIQMITGIPVVEQRLIYRGKQLQLEQSLSDCCIQNDAGLQLVGRMRSTGYPQAWQVIGDMVSIIFRLCKGEMVPSAFKLIRSRLTEYLSMTPKDDEQAACGHLQIFMSSSAPAALVMLYMSTFNGNRECADSSIRHFLYSSRSTLHKNLHIECAPIIIEFCKLLRRRFQEDPLYLMCRTTLGSLLDPVGVLRGSTNLENIKGVLVIPELMPFVIELACRLCRDLMSSSEVTMSVGPLLGDVRDFRVFLIPLRGAIMEQVGFNGPISLPLLEKECTHPLLYGEEIEFLHVIFMDLLKRMDKCLRRMEEFLAVGGSGDGELYRSGWSQYLAILKELNSISKLYEGAEEIFWAVLRHRKLSLCALIIRYAKRTDDHAWLLAHKDVTDFVSKRHLVMMMFPEVKEDYEEQHEMLIDRSQLLAESFQYIADADPEALHSGLFMEFKNEEATGPGVLREWFFLVCQAIFDPQNALFVACPNDRRRFYPNPASKVHPLHLEYFSFSGRVIALALMHKVQLGIVFDRVFFLQLAGMHVSLEDIRDADPFLYNSCKQILEMDAEFIDSDALGLTFVREVEELGSRRDVELCPGGKSIIVNSKNREEYVNLLVEHRFVTSISEQVSYFARGFADMLCDSSLQKFFFQSLELEDFDWMLHGSESAICVEDWKAHTGYNGYRETDPQILWFWKIIEEMTVEQKKIILFFWTSLKYLPVEGFRGLASRLYIYKSPEPHDHLPSSHTCFYRLCFPPYPSMAVMKERLEVITQEHVGCSFGTW